MGYTTSLIKKKTDTNYQVISYLNLQTFFIFGCIIVISSTLIIKVVFIHTDATFTCQILVIVNTAPMFNCYLLSCLS